MIKGDVYGVSLILYFDCQHLLYARPKGYTGGSSLHA